MKTIRIAAVVLLSPFFASGCGTILNLASGDPDVYGGLQKDVNYIQTPRSGGTSGVNVGGQAGMILFAAVAADTGLSLIADTLTLPLVFSMRYIEPVKKEESEAAPQ